MPGILFILWLSSSVVLLNAEPGMYDNLDTAKAAVEKAISEAKPVDYSKMND